MEQKSLLDTFSPKELAERRLEQMAWEDEKKLVGDTLPLAQMGFGAEKDSIGMSFRTSLSRSKSPAQCFANRRTSENVSAAMEKKRPSLISTKDRQMDYSLAAEATLLQPHLKPLHADSRMADTSQAEESGENTSLMQFLMDANGASSKRSTNMSEKEHRENAQLLEKALGQAIESRHSHDCRTLDVISALFQEIISVDPYYSSLLRQIKNVYEEKLSRRSSKSSERPEGRLMNELLSVRREAEGMRQKYSQLLTELKSKSICIEAQKTRIKGLTRKIESMKTGSTHHQEKIRDRSQELPAKAPVHKHIKIPKLDLSKVKNKYKDEKPKIVYPSKPNGKCSPPAPPEKSHVNTSFLYSQKSILKENNLNQTKFKQNCY